MSNWNRFAGGSALAALAMALAAPTAIYAQETTGTIRGQIASAGTNVSGAEVVITHTPSGSRATTRSDANGQFAASGLRAGGPYTIAVTAANMQSTTVDDVFLTAAAPFALSLNLEPAADRTEVVIVRASAVGRGRGDGSATGLRRDKIESVVTLSRDIRELARQSPLVTQNTVGDGGISIAGSNPRTNRITIDGVAAQDDFGLNTGGLPTRRGPISLDAVSQFNVSPAPFDVRNGGFLGGAIDIVLRSGDNNFGGSVFANFLADDLTGTSINSIKVSNKVEQTNYGATLRGPILKDRLFFALSYETYEGTDTTTRGPVDGGIFANTIVGPNGTPMTLAEISAVTDVFKTVYNSTFDFGSIPGSKPILDEKYSARIDWNISDKQRAQFTYRNAESTVFNFTNLGATTAALDSQWYFTGEADETYSLQLNSDWTDRLQTEARISYRDYERLQEPPGGQNFADITVCSTPTSLDLTGNTPRTFCGSSTGQGRGVVRFGADQFRHANFLTTTNTQAQLEARYRLGDHLIKGGVQWQNRDIFNLFVPNSDGTYYFDSIADFRAGNANRLIYTNNPSGDPTKAAADFTYSILAGYLQDTWTLNDDLRVTAGVRGETYTVPDKPALNPNFVTRNGFDNQATYDGLSVIMPRVSFNWNAPADIRVSGGIGLFSGGLPDVFLSNSYSNTGVLTVGVTIERNADGTFRETSNVALPAGVGAAALNGLVGSNFGRAVPASVLALLGGLAPPPNSETNSIVKGLDVPSEWKLNLAATGEAFGLRLGADMVFNKVQTGYAFRDLAARPLLINGNQALTPDGRRRYDGLSVAAVRTSIPGQVVTSVAAPGGASRDIQMYNPSGDLGNTFVLALSAAKEYDSGISWGLSYTFQNIEELGNSGRFSSTASSLYAGAYSDIDPELPALGRGQEEIENVIKYSVGWRGNVVGDLETRLDLFGDLRAGRPINWVMGVGAGRSTVTGLNKAGLLAYIPDFSGSVTTSTTATLLSSDTRVSFDSVATLNAVQAIVTQFGLPQGGIIPRGFSQNDQIHLVDLKFSQQLPGVFKGHKSFLTFDVSNLLNMLNDEWGVVQEFGETQTLFNVACADAAGVVTNAGTLACNRYRISNPGTILTNPATRNTDRSRWQIQVGLRYEF